jgi:hypothetical protein
MVSVNELQAVIKCGAYGDAVCGDLVESRNDSDPGKNRIESEPLEDFG